MATMADDIVDPREVQYEALTDNVLFSDVQLSYGSKRFKAHKAILAGKSTYFMSMFTGGFKEKSLTTIVLEEDDEDLLTDLLRYIYNDALVDKINLQTVEDLSEARRAYALADKYQASSVQIRLIKAMLPVFQFEAYDSEAAEELLECLTTVTPSTLELLYDDIREVMGGKNFLSLFALTAFDDLVDAHPRLSVLMLGYFWENRSAFTCARECSGCSFVHTFDESKNWKRKHFCPSCETRQIFVEMS
ncbi:hypothetical protein KVT40_003824 [Elsinoe batatas]|uniref:BTB domain-containing protein n=1 Tax=Elsinoe batatas TaxID=2601811 RepID=A0A8K0L5B2_9PEZI|nr:hypothetical protein KVT40_003824 [Elsinoe batatas]